MPQGQVQVFVGFELYDYQAPVAIERQQIEHPSIT
jgi:hypothetical protein